MSIFHSSLPSKKITILRCALRRSSFWKIFEYCKSFYTDFDDGLRSYMGCCSGQDNPVVKSPNPVLAECGSDSKDFVEHQGLNDYYIFCNSFFLSRHVLGGEDGSDF